MEHPTLHVGMPRTNRRLVGEVIRIFTELPGPEQRSLLRSFSRITAGSSGHIVAHDPTHQLTNRERQVLVLVANGYTRREIGSALQISANTAARHIANIYRKLDISTTAEAVRVAIDSGLVS